MAKKKRITYRPGKGQSVTPEYVGMENVRLEFSDSFIVQHDPDGFFLTFLQFQHPIAFTPDEKAKIKKVELKCVARVFVTPSSLDSIINALIENKDNFSKKFTIEEVEIEGTSDMPTEELPITQSEETTKEE